MTEAQLIGEKGGKKIRELFAIECEQKKQQKQCDGTETKSNSMLNRDMFSVYYFYHHFFLSLSLILFPPSSTQQD